MSDLEEEEDGAESGGSGWRSMKSDRSMSKLQTSVLDLDPRHKVRGPDTNHSCLIPDNIIKTTDQQSREWTGSWRDARQSKSVPLSADVFIDRWSA
ncbi:hypothetical protein FQN60_017447 [Etheostoma spectabile]|uniref:Uncharacterized protein n=1 Tax=Etheostoma spectabile TaxID=54343 RepID=A0A5J5C9U8_9PERO|nr:hypothetical protein FQN60_017447 [Etheostoma spectabile]